MDLQLRLLSSDPPIYTNHEMVSGQLILRNTWPVDISTIQVSLCGTADTILQGARYKESHQLLRKTHHVFPSHKMEVPSFHARTVGCGTHVFPFSIAFPEVSECYRASRNGDQAHLLQRLPPSTGKIGSTSRVRYFIEVAVTKTGIFNTTEKTTREILFSPLPPRISRQKPWNKCRSVAVKNTNLSEDRERLHLQIGVELSDGPRLYLDQPIPLKITVAKTNDLDCSSIWLNSFQSMLVETTELRAQGLAKRSTQVHIVQTMANMWKLIGHGSNILAGSVLNVDDSIWAHCQLPPTLTSNFETCNIRRTYKLEIRLGFQVGFDKFQTTVLDFVFPVYITSPPRKAEVEGTEKKGAVWHCEYQDQELEYFDSFV